MIPVVLGLSGLIAKAAVVTAVSRVVKMVAGLANTPAPEAGADAPPLTAPPEPMAAADPVVEILASAQKTPPGRWQNHPQITRQTPSLLRWCAPAGARGPPLQIARSSFKASLHPRSYPINASDPSGLSDGELEVIEEVVEKTTDYVTRSVYEALGPIESDFITTARPAAGEVVVGGFLKTFATVLVPIGPGLGDGTMNGHPIVKYGQLDTLAPTEPYNRRKHYPNSPTKADRKAVKAGKGQVADHDPPLVVRYYEGDSSRVPPEKPGFQMTPAERAASASDRERMSPQAAGASNSQGGTMAKYSRQMRKKWFGY